MRKMLAAMIVTFSIVSISCEEKNKVEKQARLDIYAGYTVGVDRTGYDHAVRSLVEELSHQPETFTGTEVRIIRFGDRHTVKAVPVLKTVMPRSPDCRTNQIWKNGSTERKRKCQEKIDRFSVEFNEKLAAIRQALEAGPSSGECVSFKNLLTRLRFEPQSVPSIIILDGTFRCVDEDHLEPLKASKSPRIVIQVAATSNFEEIHGNLERLLVPSLIIPGTSAELAVEGLGRDTQQATLQ